MKIERNSKHLFFRYLSFDKYDFIYEHENMINEFGFVWIGKFGKKINRIKLQEILDDPNGLLIIKSPVKSGGDYYLCYIEKGVFEVPEDNIFPDYYKIGLFELSSIDVWFKVTRILKVDNDIMKNFMCISNSKSLVQTVERTRTSFMYIYNGTEFYI